MSKYRKQFHKCNKSFIELGLIFKQESSARFIKCSLLYRIYVLFKHSFSFGLFEYFYLEPEAYFNFVYCILFQWSIPQSGSKWSGLGRDLVTYFCCSFIVKLSSKMCQECTEFTNIILSKWYAFTSCWIPV